MDERSRGRQGRGPEIGGKVTWDTSDVRTTYADACNVSLTRDEVALLFGVSPALQQGQEEMTGHISSCIIMNPMSAKRTLKLLTDFLREYESRYGPVDPMSSSHPSPETSSVGPVWEGSSLPLWEDPGETVELLTGLVRGLGVEFGFERSFKMSHLKLLNRRFLMTLSKGSLGPDGQETVYRLCRQLEMPDEFRDFYAENLSKAGFYHFGFEGGDNSGIYKAYQEFWSDWEQEITGRPDRSEPFLLHLGFKWDALDPTRRALTQYTCHPRLPVDRILDQISDIYGGTEGTAFGTARNILHMAASRVSPEDILYLQVTEEDNPRISFDVNLYRSGMRMKLLYPLLLQLSGHYEIPSDQFNPVFESAQDEVLGHISGGIDREGKDFFTVYYGMRGH